MSVAPILWGLSRSTRIRNTRDLSDHSHQRAAVILIAEPKPQFNSAVRIANAGYDVQETEINSL